MAELPDGLAQVPCGRNRLSRERPYRVASDKPFLAEPDQAVRELGAHYLLVAVHAVPAVLIEIDIVEAGAGVKDGIVKALEVEDAHHLIAAHRHSVNLHETRPSALVLLVKDLVARGLLCTDETALRAVEVDENLHIERGGFLLRLIDGLQDPAPAVVILQIERRYVDPSA